MAQLSDLDSLTGYQLKNKFDDAANYIKSISPKLPPEVLLQFYARYKQALAGPCTTEKPGIFDFEGKQKWHAWKSLGEMPREQAMREYITKLYEIDPEWNYKPVINTPNADQAWAKVSAMAKVEDAEIPEDEMTLTNWIQDSNLRKVEECLNRKPHLVKKKDKNGMYPLHWAADRGDVTIVEFLLDKGSNVNAQDSEGQSALHYACSVGHGPVIELLLNRKINVDIKDSDGQTAMDLIENDDFETKTLFQ